MAYQRKIYHRDEHCLNCEYPLVGDFCARCGQKAHIHKDSFWHMIIHFVADYFHYDNKFWNTIKTLVMKPGQITLDYNAGKRARYLNPIQLYIFITTLFFILFYGLIPASTGHLNIKPETSSPQFTLTQDDTIRSYSLATTDSVNQESIKASSDDSIPSQQGAYQLGKEIGKNAAAILKDEQSVQQYDSTQNSLPPHKRSNWLVRWFQRKVIMARNASHNDANFQKHMTEKAFHSTPKIFFILLPFFVFLMWLVYNKKRFLYVDHIVFSIHFHSFWFLMLICVILLTRYIPMPSIGLLLFMLFSCGIGIYLIIAMKRVYGSSWFATILKQMFLFTFYLIGFLVISIGVLAFTYLNSYS